MAFQPLPRNKQLILYILLSTRSAYRSMIDGFQAGQQSPYKITDLAGLKQRFNDVPLPNGITDDDMANTFLDDSPIQLLLDSSSVSGISSDPKAIIYALAMVYDPTNPDCPCYIEGNLIAQLIADNLPAQKPGGHAPKLILHKNKK